MIEVLEFFIAHGFWAFLGGMMLVMVFFDGVSGIIRAMLGYPEGKLTSDEAEKIADAVMDRLKDVEEVS